MAALSARRSVWRAISFTTLILPAMVRLAPTDRSTALPFSSAPEEVEVARLSVRAALSAVCRMLPVISSMAEDTCSMAWDCSEARSRRAASAWSRSPFRAAM
jgi:hypothetical protein